MTNSNETGMEFCRCLERRCRVRFRGRRGRRLGCVRLWGPVLKPIRRRGLRAPCSPGRRRASSVWSCTRWSGGDCARWACSAAIHSPTGTKDPAKKLKKIGRWMMKLMKIIKKLPAECRRGWVPGIVRYRRVNRDRKRWRWSRKLWRAGPLLIRSDLFFINKKKMITVHLLY